MKEAALLRYTRLKRLEQLFFKYINYIIKSERIGAPTLRFLTP
jgi:hypothetical protein